MTYVVQYKNYVDNTWKTFSNPTYTTTKETFQNIVDTGIDCATLYDTDIVGGSGVKDWVVLDKFSL